VITRAVGTEPDVDVDTFTIEPEDGDLFLICSDGLTDMVDDGTIIDAIGRHRDDLDEAAKALVGAANRVGGEDNITVLFFELGAVTEELSDTQRAEAVEVDEDTLSGLEAVPAVDTAVVSPQGAEALAAAQPPKRRGRTLPIVSALAVLLIAAAAVLWLLENA
jgi:PPM family protein phosphatase